MRGLLRDNMAIGILGKPQSAVNSSVPKETEVPGQWTSKSPLGNFCKHSRRSLLPSGRRFGNETAVRLGAADPECLRTTGPRAKKDCLAETGGIKEVRDQTKEESM